MIRKVEFPFQKWQYKSLIVNNGVEKLLAGGYLLGLMGMGMDEQKETLCLNN